MMDVTEFMEQNSPDSPAAAVPKRPKKAKVVFLLNLGLTIL